MNLETIQLMCEIIEKQSRIISEQSILIADLGGAPLESEINAVGHLIHDKLGM